MPLPQRVKAITFDCWSTLLNDVDWDGTMRTRVNSLVRIAAEAGLTLTQDAATELIEGSWNEHVEAWRRGELYGAAGAAKWIVGRIPSADQLPPETADRLAEALEDATSQVGTVPVDGAADVLRLLRDKGIPSALICDTGFTPSRLVRRFLDEHGLHLDHYFFSDEAAAPKPHPDMFLCALERMKVEPHEAVHIGDLRRTDVAGARAVGMGTIRFTGVHDDGMVVPGSNLPNAWGRGSPEAQGDEADAVLEKWPDLPQLLGI